MKLLALVLLLSMTAAAHGQTKTAVHFQCTCTDMVGSRLATAVRDLIAVSPRYRSVDDFSSGTGDKAVWNWGIRVVTLDPSKNDNGESAVMAVTLTIGPVFETVYVQTCGTAKIQECAATIIADLDGMASK